MSDLLVLVAARGDAVADTLPDPLDPRAVWPRTADGTTEWAARLHDELDARPTATADANADVARIASWLKAQAVGRDTVVVIEPRLTEHAALWASGADQAGLPAVRLTDSIRAAGSPVAAATSPSTSTSTSTSGHWSASAPNTRLDRSRLWVLDRAEATARSVVRALQR
jgi:hypothetical protein